MLQRQPMLTLLTVDREAIVSWQMMLGVEREIGVSHCQIVGRSYGNAMFP